MALRLRLAFAAPAAIAAAGLELRHRRVVGMGRRLDDVELAVGTAPGGCFARSTSKRNQGGGWGPALPEEAHAQSDFQRERRKSWARLLRSARDSPGFRAGVPDTLFGVDPPPRGLAHGRPTTLPTLQRRYNPLLCVNRVYSGVPADEFGLYQKIRIGPMSGKSNVVFWLEAHGYDTDQELVDAIFGVAKDSRRLLSDEQVESIVKQHIS